MLRDSKRAGYQRLTTYIYEYRQYEVDPRPPVKKEPPPDILRKAHEYHSSPHDPMPMDTASSFGHLGQSQSQTPSRGSRPMPTFVPIQVGKINYSFM